MPVTGSTLRVEGLGSLQRAFSVIDRDVATDLRATLRRAAEPVKHDAESLAASRIRRIGTPWAQMRVGVTRTSVYVAPARRGTGSRGNQRRRRPNLANLLLNRSLLPALHQNEAKVAAQVELMLAELASKWGRGG